MARNAATQRLIGDPVAPGAIGAVVYDVNGMPLTLRAAKAMSVTAVAAALERVLTQLHSSAGTPSATDPVDSLDVLYLLRQFYRPLNSRALDLSKVDRDRWSTLAGVAEVLVDAMGELQ